MKISLITVVYNGEKHISSAIDSVLSQDYFDIEYIIIDGGSTDSTMDIVKSYGDRIDVVVSERDKGIYDAMNKGIQLSSGEVVGILNSDDVYSTNSIISRIMDKFKNDGCDCSYGDLVYVNQDDLEKVIRHWKTGEKKSFRKGWHPPHPAFFVLKSVYKQFGLYDISLRVASDFEMMMRLIENHQCKLSYLPEIIVRMRIGGESNNSLKNVIRGYKDVSKAFEKNKISKPIFYPFFRYLPKIKELIS